MLTVEKHQHDPLAPGDLVRHISIHLSSGIVLDVDVWSSAVGEDEQVAHVMWENGTQTRELRVFLDIIDKA
tara:strand:- start:143 stop:355 length:213 start_codon:yes stop_codon:yes gene_type:complete